MSGSERFACDTSVAIAAMDTTHEQHHWCVDLVSSRRPALAGHAAIETYSVLTRLPSPSRLSPDTARKVIAHNFPDPCPIPLQNPLSLIERFADLGIRGGAVYDGLVALAADADNRTLLTRDERAERAYRRLGIKFEHIAGPV